MSFFRTAFSTTGFKEPSSIRLLFGVVILTMCSPVWVQTLRLLCTGVWVAMDGQAIAYAGILSGLLTALLAWARAQESKDLAAQSQAPQPPPSSQLPAPNSQQP